MRDAPEDRPGDDRTDGDWPPVDRRVPPDAEWEAVVQVPHEPSEGYDLTTTVVYAVAEAEGVAPGDVKSPPLYDVVDAAALDAALFSSDGPPDAGDDVRSTDFMYRGHRVVVRGDGWVVVYGRGD